MTNQSLSRPGLVRISFGLYNDYNEIYLLAYLLKEISQNLDFYKNKYRNSPFY